MATNAFSFSCLLLECGSGRSAPLSLSLLQVFVFTAGCIFVGLQSLASNGLITVHWDRMEKRLHSLGDFNQDGTVDEKDLKTGYDQLQAYLSAGLPSAGSFSAGFLWGMRS